ncbi:MAG: DUF2029 domain-containing protein [Chloroflexi bacterium]|nr:DUF2029 domain-containing protein [Chloroflexota bacterium]
MVIEASRISQKVVPLLLALALVAQVAWSWSHLIAHVVDYADGASDERREDFVAFYAAGTMIGEGLGSAIYQPQIVASVEHSILGRAAGRGTGLAFMNPPFVAGLVRPLAELSYGQAQAVWFGVSVLAVALSLALLRPELRRMGRGRAALFGLAALASFSVYASLLYGQLSPLVLLSWVTFYRLSVSGRYGTAGLALAASLIKPQLAFVPVVYVITTRRWRALGGLAIGATVLACVSVVLAGARTTFMEYPSVLARSIGWRGEFGTNRVNMFGWNSFFTRVLSPDEQTLTLLLTVVLSVFTLILAVLVWRKQAYLGDGSRPMLALAAATILASPHMHKHDLQILLLPAALLAAYRPDAAGLAVPALLLFLLPLATIGPNLAPLLLTAVLAVVVARSMNLRVTRGLSVPTSS